MVKFDISSNNLRAEGGKALAAGLKGNPVIMELNISSNSLGKDSGDYGGSDDISGVTAIADAIPDMGALSRTISKNRVPSSRFQELPPHVDGKGLKGKVARFEGRNVKIVQSFKKGQQLSIEWDEPKDKGALTKLTFGDKQVVTMTTEMTEADFSGKLESHEALIVAAFLPKCT
jgi:hypothetical protein